MQSTFVIAELVRVATLVERVIVKAASVSARIADMVVIELKSENVQVSDVVH